MDLNEIRNEIDNIDDQLVELFQRRMDCSRRVAEYKLENGIPVFNQEREQRILDSIEKKAGFYGSSARQLYATIMELSRALQHDLLGSGQNLKNHIFSAKKSIPYNESDISVACFGLEGAYAHKAANSIFPNAAPDFYSSFHDVFFAIQSGKAQFGVVPIENSSAGSVTDVYDLMLKYRFSIASAIHIPVNHCLAVKKGTDPKTIKKVLSHPQALSQCSHFIRSAHIEHEEAASTADAAKKVSESSDRIAAICSEEAAEKYGLEIALRGFQNDPSNTTRFLVISKELYIESDADKISLCFSLPHTTGSLYNILCRFAADGLNLTKLESRPKKGTPFEYLFYLDFAGTIHDKRTLSLMCALSDELSEFSFLGNYKEK